jgi:hypothetical protein
LPPTAAIWSIHHAKSSNRFSVSTYQHIMPAKDNGNKVAISYATIDLQNRDLLRVGDVHEHTINQRLQERPDAMHNEFDRLHHEATELESPGRSTSPQASPAHYSNANTSRPFQPMKFRASGTSSSGEHRPSPPVFGNLKMRLWFNKEAHEQPWNPLRHQADAAAMMAATGSENAQIKVKGR